MISSTPLKGRRVPLVAAFVLVVLAAAALALPLLGADGGDAGWNAAYGSGESGLLAFVEMAEVQGIEVVTLLTAPYLLEDLDVPSSAAVVVTRLEREFTRGEVGAFVAFVERGGTLVVATSGTHANGLSSRFGVEHDGHPVLSASGAPLVDAPGGERLRLAPLTALHVVHDVADGSNVVLLTSDANAFLDLNGDGRVDEFDRDGPFVVGVAVDRPGHGRAIFLGASAPFENRGLEDAATRRFTDALLRDVAPSGSTLVVFEGARDHALQPLSTAVTLMEAGTRHGWIRPVVVVALPAAVVATAWLYPGPPSFAHVYGGGLERRRKVDRSRLAADLRERLTERARDRAGLSPDAFARLPASEKVALREATVASLLSGLAKAVAIDSLQFSEEE